MARFYRRRYRRYRPRKYIRRYFRRRFRKFVNGSSRSQIRVKIPISVNMDMTRDGATLFTVPARIDPWTRTSSWASAMNSELYRTYCSLYDEVQCIGMKVRLSFTNAVGAATLPAIKVHTCWDRRYGNGEATPSADEIVKSASYLPASAINNSVCRMQRSCYQSDLIEKCQWHDSTIAQTAAPAPQYYVDQAYEAAGVNPNFFVPAFMFCVEECGTGVAWVNPSVLVDVVYYFKFRNPKFGGSAGGVNRMSSTRLAGEVVPGDDMDDDDQLIDLDAAQVASMSAMADMEASPVARAAAAAAGPAMDGDTLVSGPVRGGKKAREARIVAQRSVFGGRGSLNV